MLKIEGGINLERVFFIKHITRLLLSETEMPLKSFSSASRLPWSVVVVQYSIPLTPIPHKKVGSVPPKKDKSILYSGSHSTVDT